MQTKEVDAVLNTETHPGEETERPLPSLANKLIVFFTSCWAPVRPKVAKVNILVVDRLSSCTGKNITKLVKLDLLLG